MALQVLSFDAFVQRITTEIGLELPAPISESTSIVDDLGWDSMAVVEVLAVIDEMGSDIDDRALETVFTLGDLYHLYTVARIVGTASQPIWS